MEGLASSNCRRRRGETLGAGDSASTSVVGSASLPTNLSAVLANAPRPGAELAVGRLQQEVLTTDDGLLTTIESWQLGRAE